MKKVVFSGMPKDKDGCNVLAVFGGSLDKGAHVVNKDPNYRLTIVQGKNVLGSIEGKGKVAINEKTYPGIAFDKKGKSFYDVYVIASKLKYDVFQASKVNAPIKNWEKACGGEKTLANLAQSMFEEACGNAYSMVALFKTSAIDIVTSMYMNDAVKGRNGKQIDNVSIVGSGNMFNVLSLYMNNYVRDNIVLFDMFDDLKAAIKIEKIRDVKSKTALIFIKSLEAYIESKMEESFGIIGKCSIVGTQDNLLAYM